MPRQAPPPAQPKQPSRPRARGGASERRVTPLLPLLLFFSFSHNHQTPNNHHPQNQTTQKNRPRAVAAVPVARPVAPRLARRRLSVAASAQPPKFVGYVSAQQPTDYQEMTIGA
jgi:hypothetical protein